jgi:hypothetical protein
MIIEGVILDKEFNALEDVNIIVLSTTGNPTTIGTRTKADGSFFIDNKAILSNAVIQISYIGYKNVLATANDLKSKSIILEENPQELQEVVVSSPNKKDSYGWLWGFLTIGIGLTYYYTNKPKRVKI